MASIIVASGERIVSRIGYVWLQARNTKPLLPHHYGRPVAVIREIASHIGLDWCELVSLRLEYEPAYSPWVRLRLLGIEITMKHTDSPPHLALTLENRTIEEIEPSKTLLIHLLPLKQSR